MSDVAPDTHAPITGRWRAVILGFVAFATSFGAHVVAVNLPVYAQQVGIGMTMIGVLIAAYDFAELAAKPVFGVVADRAGMKRTMLIGIGFFCVASILYFPLGPHLLLLVRFLQGLGAAGLSIVSASLIAEYFPRGRGQAFGIYNAIKGAGYVISPVVGGAIVWASHFGTIFIVTFGIGVVVFILASFLPDPQAGGRLEDDDDDLSFRQFFAVFRNRVLLPWYAIIVINMFLVSILFGFLPVYVHSLGYNQLVNGLIVGSATVSYLVVQPFAGRLADRVEPMKVILAGLILSAAGVALVPFTRGGWLVAVVVMGGLGVGTVWTNSDAAVSHLAAKGQVGSTLGAAGSFKELGDMVGPLLIGILADSFGLRAAFVTCGLLGALALPLLRLAKTAGISRHTAG